MRRGVLCSIERLTGFLQVDSDDFLDSLSYAQESWFALEGPKMMMAQSSPPTTTTPTTSTITTTAATTTTSTARAPKRAAPSPSSVVTEEVALPSTPDSLKFHVAPSASPPAEKRKVMRMLSNSDFSSADDDSLADEQSYTTKKKSMKKKKKSSTVAHTSAFRGVSCCGKDRKFQARIRDGSKVHYLGRFDNEFDAAIKYDEAARSHKGDQAMPNFVEMSDEEIIALREHYFQNGQKIMPEFLHYLYLGSERGEGKRALKKQLAAQ